MRWEQHYSTESKRWWGHRLSTEPNQSEVEVDGCGCGGGGEGRRGVVSFSKHICSTELEGSQGGRPRTGREGLNVSDSKSNVIFDVVF